MGVRAIEFGSGHALSYTLGFYTIRGSTLWGSAPPLLDLVMHLAVLTKHYEEPDNINVV